MGEEGKENIVKWYTCSTCFFKSDYIHRKTIIFNISLKIVVIFYCFIIKLIKIYKIKKKLSIVLFFWSFWKFYFGIKMYYENP